MNTQAKQEIAKLIINVASNTSSSSHTKEAKWHSKILGLDDGSTYGLIDEIADKYDDTGKRLLKMWSSKFSEAYVFAAVHRLVNRAVMDVKEDNTQETAEYLVEQLGVLADEFKSYSQEQVVYIPLSGILMRVDSQRFGNITLINMNDVQFVRLIREIGAVVMDSDLSHGEQERAINSYSQEIQKRLLGKVCAVCSVTAEPGKAKELAIEECRRVLDLLRYSSHRLYRTGAESYKMAVGFWGEVVRYNREIVIVPSNSPGLTISSELIGTQAFFIIDENIVKLMDAVGVFKAATVLAKKQRTEFDNMIIQGIHAFAKSYTQNERQDQLLSLITCLETFLKADREDRIKEAVAIGVAHILGKKEDRMNLYEVIGQSYSTRSGLTHGSDREILDVELHKLRDIVGDFLEWMIKQDKFKTLKELSAWLLQQRLGLSGNSQQDEL